ncbi:12138_t:CDS:2, partial [Acaulospora morrowiae]
SVNPCEHILHARNSKPIDPNPSDVEIIVFLNALHQRPDTPPTNLNLVKVLRFEQQLFSVHGSVCSLFSHVSIGPSRPGALLLHQLYTSVVQLYFCFTGTFFICIKKIKFFSLYPETSSISHTQISLHNLRTRRPYSQQEDPSLKFLDVNLSPIETMSINNMNFCTPMAMSTVGTFDRRNDPSFVQSLSRPANSSRRTGPWEPHEDERLLAIVSELGVKHWKLIGIRHGLRDGKQCRERWHNHLNPDLKYGPLTAEEDLKIIEYHSKMGTKWAVMSQMLNRPANLIKNRFYSSLSKKRDFSQVENNDGENERSSSPISSSGAPISSMINSPILSQLNALSSSELSNSDSCTFASPPKRIKFYHENSPNPDVPKSKYEMWIRQEQMYRAHINSWHDLQTPATSPGLNEVNKLNEFSCPECQQYYSNRQCHHDNNRHQRHHEDSYFNNGCSHRRENRFADECHNHHRSPQQYQSRRHLENPYDKYQRQQNHHCHMCTNDDSIPTPTYTPISSPRPIRHHYRSSALEQLADLAIMNSCDCRTHKDRNNIMSISAVLN